MLALSVAGVLVLVLVTWLLVRPVGDVGSGATEPLPTMPTTESSLSTDEIGLRLPRKPDVVVLGDAWSAGAGATPGKDWVSRVSRRLDWTTGVIPGGATTGYLNPGVIKAGTYLDRLRRMPDNKDVDLVVVQGGLSDIREADVDTMAFNRAVRRVLRVAHRIYPRAQRLVIGPLNPYSPDPGDVETIDSRIGYEAREAGVPFISPTQGQWFGASTDEIAALLSGSAAGDPNDKGHRRFANRVIDELERLAAIEADRGQ